MKRKKGLFAVVAALAASSVMAVMAYTNATVTNASTLSVVNTKSALLSLQPGNNTLPGLKDSTCSIDGENLVFNFNKGLSGKEYGLQKNSTYQWFNDVENKYYGLFKVTNNTNNDLWVTVKATGVPSGVKIEAVRCWSSGSSGSKYDGWHDITNVGMKTQYWNPGANNDFGIKITVGNENVSAEQLKNLKITVSGDIN